jgi:phosphoribosylformylglycinamidine cyclo-ligase
VHSNGFSLVRHVLLQGARLRLDAHVDELERPLGEELLTPTRIYAKDCLSLIDETAVHGFAHITGGGLAANLARVIPPHLSATVDRGTWTPPPIFSLVAGRGRVEAAEMERTFNMGVGMVALVPADDVDRALAVLLARHVPAWVAGEVIKGSGEVVLTGEHPS